MIPSFPDTSLRYKTRSFDGHVTPENKSTQHAEMLFKIGGGHPVDMLLSQEGVHSEPRKAPDKCDKVPQQAVLPAGFDSRVESVG